MTDPSALTAQFPKLRSTHRGKWVPIYLEPMVGSGERLCIGVAARDEKSFVVEPVDNLKLLSRVYGDASSAFMWAAHLALGEIRNLMSAGGGGFERLSDAPASVEGLVIGEVRQGAGTGLHDLAQVALRQVSSLTSELPAITDVGEGIYAVIEGESEPRVAAPDVERRVRAQLKHVEPQWGRRFGQRLRPTQQRSSIRYGFIGDRLAVNFSSLTSGVPRIAAQQVDKSKARLWDLQQLKTGILSDLFGAQSLKDRTHQLLVFSPHGGAVRSVGARGSPYELIVAAEEELKSEAKRADIECLPMSSIEDIANHLLRLERGA